MHEIWSPLKGQEMTRNYKITFHSNYTKSIGRSQSHETIGLCLDLLKSLVAKIDQFLNDSIYHIFHMKFVLYYCIHDASSSIYYPG